MDLVNISSLVHEGIWAISLFLAALIGAFVLLARAEAVRLLNVIFQSLVSFFVSPWGYLRKTIRELVLGSDNPRLRDTDHYLLNKLINTAQVALVALVVLGIGVTVTAAVYSSLPPFYLRQALANAKVELAKASGSVAELSAKIKQEDDDWQNRRNELIRKAKDEEQQKISATRDVLIKDQSSLGANPDTARVVTMLKTYFDQRTGQRYAAEQAKDFIRRLPSLNETQISELIAYCDHWSELQAVSTVTPQSVEDIRAKVQPDHDELVRQLQQTSAYIET